MRIASLGHSGSRAFVAAAAACVLSFAGDARAGDAKATGQSEPSNAPGVTSENRALAETLFFAGRGMMEAERYAEACQKLAESYRLDPAAGTLLNLAVCHEKQGKIASAWGEFSQAVSEAHRANRAEREQFAREPAAAIEPDLPRLTIEVAKAVQVPGLTIERNGVALNSAAWDTELPVDPGEGEIVASAPGYVSRTLKVTIAKREHARLTIPALEPLPPPPEEVVYWTGRRKLGVVLGAAGLAAVGVGTVVGLGVLANRQQSDDGCAYYDGVRRCTVEGANAMARAQTGAWVTDVAMGVGALGLAAGAYFFFTGGQGRERAPEPAKPGVAWRLDVQGTPGGARGVVQGTF